MLFAMRGNFLRERRGRTFAGKLGDPARRLVRQDGAALRRALGHLLALVDFARAWSSSLRMSDETFEFERLHR